MQHQFVDIDLADTPLDTLLHDIFGEGISPMHSYPQPSIDRLVNLAQPVNRVSKGHPDLMKGKSYRSKSNCGPLAPYSPCIFPKAGAKKSTPVA